MENYTQQRTTEDLIDEATALIKVFEGYATWEVNYILQCVNQMLPTNSVIKHLIDGHPYKQSDQLRDQSSSRTIQTDLPELNKTTGIPPRCKEIPLEQWAIDSLDEGIREAVVILNRNGIETFESCQGGKGHCFPEPTISFLGDQYEGIRAALVGLENDLPIGEVRRCFRIMDKEFDSSHWEMTLRNRPPSKELHLDPEAGNFTED